MRSSTLCTCAAVRWPPNSSSWRAATAIGRRSICSRGGAGRSPCQARKRSSSATRSTVRQASARCCQSQRRRSRPAPSRGLIHTPASAAAGAMSIVTSWISVGVMRMRRSLSDHAELPTFVGRSRCLAMSFTWMRITRDIREFFRVREPGGAAATCGRWGSMSAEMGRWWAGGDRGCPLGSRRLWPGRGPDVAPRS
jgi:hypothetical protein